MWETIGVAGPWLQDTPATPPPCAVPSHRKASALCPETALTQNCITQVLGGDSTRQIKSFDNWAQITKTPSYFQREITCPPNDMRLIGNSKYHGQVATRGWAEDKPSQLSNPLQIPLSKRQSQDRTSMSTQPDPLLVGGSQQVLLQGEQLAYAAYRTLLPYFRSRLSRPSSAHDLWNKHERDGLQCHAPSKQKAGGGTWTFQRQKTFVFPWICFPLLEWGNSSHANRALFPSTKQLAISDCHDLLC